MWGRGVVLIQIDVVWNDWGVTFRVILGAGCDDYLS